MRYDYGGFTPGEVAGAMRGRWADLYAGYAALRPDGRELRGPCPLHGGDGPNFVVNPETGYWFCHSQCSGGGSAFQMIERLEGIPYAEAVQTVAQWAGMAVTIPRRPGRPWPARRVTAPKEAKPVGAPLATPSSLVTPTRLPEGKEGAASGAPAQTRAIPLIRPEDDARCQAALRADAEVLEWLHAHRGLTQETLERFGVGLTRWTPSDRARALVWPRVTFPVRDRAGTLTNIRKHLFAFDPAIDRSKLGKTLPWAGGLPSDLFPLSALWGEGEVRLTDHLLLVEGEADALLANQMGFPALSGTLGAGGWSPRNTEDLAGLPRLTLLYDADEAGRKGAKARARDLAGTVPDIRIATLPPGMGKDLTEWVMDGGGTAEALAKIIAGAAVVSGAADTPNEGSSVAERLSLNSSPALPAPGASRKPIAERTVDLADVPPPPADLPYLWGPYFNEGASHWLTGKTGLGKSTFAFNLACALAEGRTLWGVPCRARRLLYVDLESGDIGRSLKVQRLYGDRPRQAGQLRFVREPLRLPDESAELVAYAEAEKFDLLIFDTARRVFAVRDENDNAEVYNRVIPTLDALKARGIATLTMGHPPKNGGLGARGAGAQEDAGDVNLLLTMHRGEVTDADGVLALIITKNRLLGLGTPPLYLKRIGHDQFERVDTKDLPPSEDGPAKESPRDRCRLAVLALLGSNSGLPVAYKDVLHALEASGHNRTTLHRSLKELMDEGEVEQPSSGFYVLSDPFA